MDKKEYERTKDHYLRVRDIASQEYHRLFFYVLTALMASMWYFLASKYQPMSIGCLNVDRAFKIFFYISFVCLALSFYFHIKVILWSVKYPMNHYFMLLKREEVEKAENEKREKSEVELR